jgi:hypothetical protein
VLGQPHWRYKGNHFWAPVGQVDLFQSIFGKTSPSEQVEKLRQEYIAISQALVATGEDFAVINLSRVDDTVGLTNDSLMLRRGLPDQLYTFPRDAWMTLPGICLLCTDLPPKNETIDGLRLFTSLLGEGGRVLGRQKTVLVPELLTDRNGPPWIIKSLESGKELEAMGLSVTYLPNPDGLGLKPELEKKLTFTDHLDRIAGLLEDGSGNLHLVIDPDFHFHESRGPKSRLEALDEIRRRCEPASIEVHAPEYLSVPYSVGFYQLPGGKVVLTSGDDAVAEVVASIVGQENIFLTDTAIELFPTFVSAGIHCLISELPEFLCSHDSNTD